MDVRLARSEAEGHVLEADRRRTRDRCPLPGQGARPTVGRLRRQAFHLRDPGQRGRPS
jgi:hypothetical protein